MVNLAKSKGLLLMQPPMTPPNVLQQKRQIVFQMENEKPSRLKGYYVVQPVLPDETPENNVFLSNIARNEDWPAVAKATPKEIYQATVRMVMEYGVTHQDYMEFLKEDKSVEKTFDTTLLPLLAEEYDCEYAFNTLFIHLNFYFFRNDPETGPWRGLMEPHSMYTLLKYCGDRSIRRTAWENWVSRVSFKTEEIRHHSTQIVKPLGFKNIAEHRLCNTMAGSPQTVCDFVNELVDRIHPD
uniref:RRM domain-containing protein n=1 Tax=Ditylenchus dipsaci TaxID=166011 RepID=A0A915DAX4_9BILA